MPNLACRVEARASLGNSVKNMSAYAKATARQSTLSKYNASVDWRQGDYPKLRLGSRV